VSLARQLEQQLPNFEWRLETAPVSAEMILTGDAYGRRIHLYSQLVCPSMEQPNRYDYTSISRERRPDIVFEYSNGQVRRFICLDSKYRTSRSGTLDAMASAHIYRDSVKLNGEAPDYSLLLQPHSNQAAQLGTEQYIDRYRVGCVGFSSLSDAHGMVQRLLDWFLVK
jgi:hypothetical protein